MLRYMEASVVNTPSNSTHKLDTNVEVTVDPPKDNHKAPGSPTDVRDGSRALQDARSYSMAGFQQTSLGISAQNMRNSLLLLKANHPEEGSEKFSTELDEFYSLFTRYLDEKGQKTKLNWDKIKSPAEDQIIPYNKLRTPEIKSKENQNLLSKLAVLKLNGGLGTTMGCVGPKSVIEVRDGMTFLDLIVRQIEYLNSENSVDVPLILMNSFNTDKETSQVIHKYSGHAVKIMTFNQSRFPRFFKDSMQPLPKTHDGPITDWYPPGHGDMYEALSNSGVLDQLLADGKEYIFVSNVDNLGATVDTAILAHMEKSGAEFIMEVTDKTKADIKGGTIIDYEGTVRLLEIAQVNDFKSIKKRLVDESALRMEIIVNQKTHESGEKIIQLETAVGAAIKHFKGAHGINVPRRRFLPVKSTSDLFHITSDLYSVHHGQLLMSPKRLFATSPVVKLGDHFKKVNHFLSRFQSPPHILELDHLTVTGDVTFGHDVVLKGTVIIVANYGARIDIPSGSILDDKVVSGNLRILDH
ncbi:UTP-glucose-1-phosphate uridylyltransferase [Clydaea vesicula]|uniref:UTP--glucose-1-phosphate uridylyltransferase n=1 Tax=Clydaea vesicula TaxID=447962 RepID=A0AAD5Y3I9_9FUNG|nr:UTP-glucose-1-phosphate uridylyltransferase [Clydaea vesicula]